MEEQSQRKTKFLQCLFHFDVTALSSFHLQRGKPAERDAPSPCGKQLVRCLHYSWPSPGAGSSDQPNEKHMKAGEPTMGPPQLGKLLYSHSMKWSSQVQLIQIEGLSF